jgi:hypothetical protein
VRSSQSVSGVATARPAKDEEKKSRISTAAPGTKATLLLGITRQAVVQTEIAEYVNIPYSDYRPQREEAAWQSYRNDLEYPLRNKLADTERETARVGGVAQFVAQYDARLAAHAARRGRELSLPELVEQLRARVRDRYATRRPRCLQGHELQQHWLTVDAVKGVQLVYDYTPKEADRNSSYSYGYQQPQQQTEVVRTASWTCDYCGERRRVSAHPPRTDPSTGQFMPPVPTDSVTAALASVWICTCTK